MNYTVFLSSRAVRDLRRLPTRPRRRVEAVLSGLEIEPRPSGCLKLTNSEEWRIRVGAYRIIYLIDDAGRQVTVTRIRDRKDVYDP